ncbi:hypothetical protein AZZ62_000466, partial [Klebsiella variicola]
PSAPEAAGAAADCARATAGSVAAIRRPAPASPPS